jgi:hypothetical protein
MKLVKSPKKVLVTKRRTNVPILTWSELAAKAEAAKTSELPGRKLKINPPVSKNKLTHNNA